MNNKKLTLQQIIDFENELKLIETKVKARLREQGISTYIAKILKIDLSQLSDWKSGRRQFSLKRLLTIAKILVQK